MYSVRKCELVANRYLLSKKETEVLFLLAKGRNAAYIQEQLYISEAPPAPICATSTKSSTSTPSKS